MASYVEVDQAEKKCMIVIVDRHVLWSLWCIDFLRNAVQEGMEIIVLDLSRFRPKHHMNNSKYLLTKLYRKNRIECILQRVMKNLRIQVISAKKTRVQWESPRVRPHNKYPLSFLNGLDSQYFEEIGAHIFSESQIASRVLNHSMDVYDAAFEITVNTIIEREITKVIVPGGRTLVPNAVIAATLNQKTLCTVLEQATSKSSRYLEYPIDFRQNTNSHQQEIDRVWAEGGEMKYQIAKNYLDAKLFGSQMGRNFFLQFDSNLAIPVPENCKLATIFVGSGFEMVPSEVDSQITHLGSKQQKDIFQLFIEIASENGFTVVLRGHPASLGYEKMYAAEDLEWAEFCNENKVLHLASDSKIDTYKLIRESDLNVVYASTVGIDAIILGKNTLLLGNVDWAHLVPEICAFDKQSIRERFQDFKRDVDVEKLYPYAFYMECGGIEISHVEFRPDGSIFYEGQQIGAAKVPQLQKIFKR